MARLSKGQRDRLPASDFAGPNRTYPVPNKSHAEMALADAYRAGGRAEEVKIARGVHRKYPHMHIRVR